MKKAFLSGVWTILLCAQSSAQPSVAPSIAPVPAPSPSASGTVAGVSVTLHDPQLWVNHQPTVGDAPRKLNVHLLVDVDLANSQATPVKLQFGATLASPDGKVNAAVNSTVNAGGADWPGTVAANQKVTVQINSDKGPEADVDSLLHVELEVTAPGQPPLKLRSADAKVTRVD
jgi:hypothetical protein